LILSALAGPHSTLGGLGGEGDEVAGKPPSAAGRALPGPHSTNDWPQWRGPLRNGETQALAARTQWPEGLKPGWKISVGSGHSSPVVSGGRVFQFSRQGDQETLQALDLATGARRWQQSHPAPYSMNMAALSHGKGPKATPAVAGGRVFTFGISGILSAHDAQTGRLIWRKEFGQEYPATSPTYGTAQSPLVDGSRVIVHVGGPRNGAVSAFDAATGAVAWSWKGDGPGYASPVLAELGGTRQVVAFTESMLVGLAADSGRLLWKTPFTTGYDQNAVTPLVTPDGLLVYSGLEHPVTAVRVTQRAGVWSAATAWENAEVSAYMSTPVMAAGRVCGLSHKKKGQVFCLDAATGRTVWLSDGRQGENASLVAAGTRLLVLTTDGELLVVDAAAPAFATLRRWSVASTATWAHLAVVPEGVLVKDAESLALLRF
jgi:outer membrane protein assembly factor BamB